RTSSVSAWVPLGSRQLLSGSLADQVHPEFLVPFRLSLPEAPEFLTGHVDRLSVANLGLHHERVALQVRQYLRRWFHLGDGEGAIEAARGVVLLVFAVEGSPALVGVLVAQPQPLLLLAGFGQRQPERAGLGLVSQQCQARVGHLDGEEFADRLERLAL